MNEERLTKEELAILKDSVFVVSVAKSTLAIDKDGKTVTSDVKVVTSLDTWEDLLLGAFVGKPLGWILSAARDLLGQRVVNLKPHISIVSGTAVADLKGTTSEILSRREEEEV